MKKIKHLLIPENKQYLLWVFLFIFSILLTQLFLYPKFQQIDRYKSLTNNYRNEINDMNEKISESMIKKSEMEKIEKNINEKMSYKGNIVFSLKNKVINKMPSSFVVNKIISEKTFLSGDIETIPISLEFESTKKDLSLFLEKLFSLPLPVEINSIKIDGLSPSKISVKIQMIFEKRNKS